MAEAISVHSPIIEEWLDEQDLAISALKSTITLFIPQFAQSNTHPRVTLNNSILPLERTPCKFNTHVKSLVTPALGRINILTGTN